MKIIPSLSGERGGTGLCKPFCGKMKLLVDVRFGNCMSIQTESRHTFLVQAESRQAASHQVLHFLETTELVSYGSLNIDETAVMAGNNDAFWQILRQGIEKNRAFSQQILEELQRNGVREAADLLNIPLGYPSKLLHILAHMIDGFVGIDSVFYNLIEGSHWLGGI